MTVNVYNFYAKPQINPEITASIEKYRKSNAIKVLVSFFSRKVTLNTTSLTAALSLVISLLTAFSLVYTAGVCPIVALFLFTSLLLELSLFHQFALLWTQDFKRQEQVREDAR
ncbi:MAG: hypothetical protein RDV48_13140 [Candidatus Eremiobacteraeota bacterium]|nr:hypothetical protein [Candidatus Eremiobacteraeota bacterium]